jgi:hypothetical protein
MGKPSKKVLRLLEFLSGGPKLESQVVGSGLSAALNDALLAGWCDMQPSATVKEGDGRYPATECTITTEGRAALKETING